MDGTAASLIDLGWFCLVLLFSSCVTVGIELPSLSLCCYIYKMEEITLPAPIETTRGKPPLPALTSVSAMCTPGLTWTATLLPRPPACWMPGLCRHPCQFLWPLTGQVSSSFFVVSVYKENPQPLLCLPPTSAGDSTKQSTCL